MDQPPLPAPVLSPSAPAPYSPFADWLSKFHTSSEPIQVLWIVAIMVVALAIAWLAIRSLTEILARRARPIGRLVLGVYQDPHGRYMLYRPDRDIAEVDWREPTLPKPPLPDGRGMG